jgi:tRNA pseudouridine55 synthase
MDPTGLIVVDKPAGMTSHDVVARVRRITGTRRVGHGGTLDPMATGVLIIGVGRATRLLTYVIGSDKEYSATIRLGQRTVTDDAEGEVVAAAPAGRLEPAAVQAALARLTGQISQVPSAVSAIKVAGRRSYARVRAGEQVALAPRPVTVSRLELTGVRRPQPELIDLDVEVACSSGTYVRALARDLGDDLGVGGHLTALRRTAAGAFRVAAAASLEALAEEPARWMISLAEAAGRMLPRREASAAEARVLGHGGRLQARGMAGPYAVFDPAGEVIAVVVEQDGRARAEVVLTPTP